MGYRVESGYIRDGADTIVSVWVHPGDPRLGTYDKTTPVENTNDATKYLEMGITHLTERVTALEATQ